jgi:hypothetical protein
MSLSIIQVVIVMELLDISIIDYDERLAIIDCFLEEFKGSLMSFS